MNIKDLIEKYFEGETTLEEEVQLSAHFNSGEVDESLKSYAPLFQFLKNEQQQALGGDFDNRLLHRLENGSAKIIPLHWVKKALRVAAVGAVLLAAFCLLKPENSGSKSTAIQWEKYETTDPNLAYEQTKEALKLLSSKLKKGSKKAVDEVSKTEKVSKFFN